MLYVHYFFLVCWVLSDNVWATWKLFVSDKGTLLWTAQSATDVRSMSLIVLELECIFSRWFGSDLLWGHVSFCGRLCGQQTVKVKECLSDILSKSNIDCWNMLNRLYGFPMNRCTEEWAVFLKRSLHLK